MSREGRRRWGLWETFTIGRQQNPMMKRIRLIQTPVGGIYLHLIYREDLDPVEHDHPWNFVRIVLRGGYQESVTQRSHRLRGAFGTLRPWRPGYFPTDASHRIFRVKPGTVSLVLVGPKRRTWGFWIPRWNGGWWFEWTDYRDYLGLRVTAPSDGSASDA